MNSPMSANGRRELDVLAAGELRIEARPELEDRGDAPMRDHRSRRRLQRAGDQLQERRLSRAVASENADRLARLDRQRDVAQRPEFRVELLASAQQRLQQAVLGLLVNLIALAEMSDFDAGALT